MKMSDFLLPVFYLLSPISSYATMIPNISNPSGTDKFRLSDGTTCESAVATGITAQIGVYGENGYGKNGNLDSNYQNGLWNINSTSEGDKGVYAGLTYQFGGTERIDCSVLYKMELETKRRENELNAAKHELEMLKIKSEKERILNRNNMEFIEQ
ncbi:hypothetical protein [Aliivibrio sp. SR45-2]|uniref:hypothetical protein n=1 Tax=Aliivibrio sp. SR45-2 TaxID=2760931 RepID=UPI0015FDE44B|nr:hypothetical protein [Aliivibrio sp. SR45-2]MBB1313404.1 hypothetical protein [Aliivibrio sp. SR45-2]